MIKRVVCGLLLWSMVCSVPVAQTQTPEQLVQQIKLLLDQLVPPPVLPTAITTVVGLDTALVSSAPGAVLVLSPSLVYPKGLTLAKSVWLKSSVTGTGRMGLTDLAPTFLAGLMVPGTDVTLSGIEVRHGDPQHTIIEVTGRNFTLDRGRLLGNPVTGGRRGIALNGANSKLINSYIEDCFLPMPGDDSQAVSAWNTPGPILIENNYLSGGSETLMVGGADPTSPENTPAHIVIRGNTITKRPAWQFLKIGVKNALELKNAKFVLIEHNVISYSWAAGQGGYLVMFTVRNQNGTAPWSNVTDVETRFNTYSHGAAAINILGMDNNQLSGRLSRVHIHDETFTDIDAKKYSTATSLGSAKLIQIGAGTQDLTITRNRFAAVNQTSVVYFYGAKNDNLIITTNTWPKTLYGVFGVGASVGKAWPMYVNTGTLSGNIETP